MTLITQINGCLVLPCCTGFPYLIQLSELWVIVTVEVVPCPLTSGHTGRLTSAAGAIAGSACNFAMFAVFTLPLSKP